MHQKNLEILTVHLVRYNYIHLYSVILKAYLGGGIIRGRRAHLDCIVAVAQLRESKATDISKHVHALGQCIMVAFCAQLQDLGLPARSLGASN